METAAQKRLFRFSGQQKQEIISALTSLLQRHAAIQFAYLYGSFLADMPCHDIDIGVYLDGLAPLDMGLFAVELSAQLGSQAKCPVDVRILNNAPLPFIYQVLRGKLLLENNPDLHGRIFEHTVSRYLDLKPLLLRATKEAFTNA